MISLRQVTLSCAISQYVSSSITVLSKDPCKSCNLFRLISILKMKLILFASMEKFLNKTSKTNNS